MGIFDDLSFIFYLAHDLFDRKFDSLESDKDKTSNSLVSWALSFPSVQKSCKRHKTPMETNCGIRGCHLIDTKLSNRPQRNAVSVMDVICPFWKGTNTRNIIICQTKSFEGPNFVPYKKFIAAINNIDIHEQSSRDIKLNFTVGIPDEDLFSGMYRSIDLYVPHLTSVLELVCRWEESCKQL